MPPARSSWTFAATGSLCGAIVMVAAAGGACAGDAQPSMEVLTRPCAGCHGRAGVSVGPTTSNLAGQPAAYIVSVMKAYRSGDRPATIMDRLAKAYEDRDFEAMGAYYAAQPLARTVQKTDPAKRERGATLHRRLCAECHTDGGRRFQFEDSAGPALAGQRIDYLNTAIRQYFTRDRDMPRKMGWQLLQLGAGDAEALAHFYASQN